MQVATPLLCAGAASCPCCALPVSSTQPVALKAQTWRLKERWFVFPASDPLAACRGRLVLRAEHRFINTSALQVVPAARLALSLRPGALPVPRGLAGSWQDPAASWRGSSACSQRGGVAAWQDHSVAGITVWPWAPLLSQDSVTMGIKRQQSCCPAWQLGTLWASSGGQNLSAYFSCWEDGSRGRALRHCSAGHLGWVTVTTPKPGASPRLGAALWAVQRGWLILSRALSVAKPWPHPEHPTGASRRDRL